MLDLGHPFVPVAVAVYICVDIGEAVTGEPVVELRFTFGLHVIVGICGVNVYMVPTAGWPAMVLFGTVLLVVLVDTVTDWKLAAPAVKPTDASEVTAAIVP